LATRVRELIEARVGGPVDEKNMFGGLGFMVNTHMAVGLHNGGGLIMPMAAENADAATERGAEPMTMGGKVSPGWMIIPDSSIATEEDLAWWVDTGVAQATSKTPNPPKAPTAKK
jgi:TfoX/Sxy family transcriptional regulator of competence genes